MGSEDEKFSGGVWAAGAGLHIYINIHIYIEAQMPSAFPPPHGNV